MATFFQDIYGLSGQEYGYFEKRHHEKEILERLCDRSASLEVWEAAVRRFLSNETFVRARYRPC